VFNLQGSEIIVILLLALVILGPERLPDAVRKFAQTYGELKKMGNGFQSELQAVLDEPIREMKETARLVQEAADPKKVAEQADEDRALREASKSTAITDVPITEASLESTDPADSGTVRVDEVTAGMHTASESTADDSLPTDEESDDGPPVIINQIAAANARGPIVPEVLADDVDNVTDHTDQPIVAAGDVIADADVTADADVIADADVTAG